ncbi:MAG: DMT family transporter [Alphaproteobacteria bacterium]|nr:MAG: DMT family transporter [Alphaproteobacteria bacterium]
MRSTPAGARLRAGKRLAVSGGGGRAGLLAVAALTMAAFAANSLLNRAALTGGSIGALDFAALRTVSGALCLLAVVAMRRRHGGGAAPGRARRPIGEQLVGAGSLLGYMIGFSLAYLGLDAGAGALILFGAVQLTMFAGAALGGARPPLRHWIGAVLALAGLAWLSWPQPGAALRLWPALEMAFAGVSWGIYSLAGRRAADPLQTTASNFALAAPLLLLAAAAAHLSGSELWPGVEGLALAVVCGALTSGLGYAMWYSVLPRLAASTAGVLQLTAPVLAALGGAVLLGEAFGLRLVIAAALVLGGVGLTIAGPVRRRPRPQRRSGSSGS